MKTIKIFERGGITLMRVFLIAVIAYSTTCFAQIDKKTFAIKQGYVLGNLSASEAARINQAVQILLDIITSGFTNFQACMDRSPLVEYSCSKWPVSRHAAESLRLPLITKIIGYNARPMVNAEAPVGISDEKLWIDHNFLASNTARRVAAVIAHEIMHNRGYTHKRFDFGNRYYPNTVPEQCEACVENGIPNPAGGPSALGFCTSFDAGDNLAVGNIDGRGGVEVLVAEDDGGTISIYSNRGIFLRSIETSYDYGGDDIAVGDLNGDGTAEILIAEDNGGRIDVYNSNGTRIRTLARAGRCRSGFDSGGDGLAAADMNGDGRAEIFVAEDDGGGIRIFRVDNWLNDEICLTPVGRPIIRTRYDRGDSMAAADMNGDGIAEILIAEDNGGLVLVYDLRGTIVRRINTSYDYGGDDIAVGDLNGDGRIEILVAEDNGGKIEIY